MQRSCGRSGSNLVKGHQRVPLWLEHSGKRKHGRKLGERVDLGEGSSHQDTEHTIFNSE